MITIERQGLGFLVRAKEPGMRWRGWSMPMAGIEDVCQCVRHYYGQHFHGEEKTCPICKEAEAKRKQTA